MRALNKVVTALSGAVISTMVVACSSINSGIVVDKQYEPAYTYMQPICSSYNSSGQCNVWTHIPHHVDQQWTITFEGLTEPKDGEEQKNKKRTVEVSEQFYETVLLGDEVSIDENGDIWVNNEKVLEDEHVEDAKG